MTVGSTTRGSGPSSGRRASVLARLRSGTDSLWVVPSAFALAAVVAAFALVYLESSGGLSLPTVPGGADGARAVLSAIAGSMISFTALVFSITVVVLQLASSQFSPRVLRTFLKDRVTQMALGTFVATFVFSIVVLASVQGASTRAQEVVPTIATAAAIVLVLASVVVFLVYIQHITDAIRVTHVMASVAAETRSLIDRRFPADAEQPPAPVSPPVLAEVPAGRSGVVTFVDVPRLTRTAQRYDLRVDVVARLGAFVPEGAALLVVREGIGQSGATRAAVDGPGGRRRLPEGAASELRSAVRLGRDQDMQQDVGFGFRQLADIAERALSAAVNDTTTALQAVDHAYALARVLVTRPVPAWVGLDGEGRVLVVAAAAGLDDLLAPMFVDVADTAVGFPRVRRRLGEALDDMLSVARAEHQELLRRLRSRLMTSAPARPAP